MNQPASPQRSSPTAIRFAVLAWLCLLAALAYVHRGCLSVPAEDIQRDLKIDEKLMGLAMSVFFLGYTVFQLPSGWLGDRWGTRRALTFFVLLWSAATGWMGLTGGFLGLLLSRLVNGMAQAGIFPCCVKTISRWFPETGRAVPTGLLGSFMSVGAALAAALTALLLKFLDWPAVFLWLAVPGFLCALGFWWWFRDEPAEHPSVNAAELELIEKGSVGARSVSEGGAKNFAHASGSDGNLSSISSILLTMPMLLICAQQFFRAAGYIFYLTWFPTFLQKARSVSVEDSGYLTSLPLLGVVAGSAVGGWLLDRIYRLTGSKQRSRQGVAVASIAACALLVFLAYHTDGALWTTAVLTAGSFCAGVGGPAAYTVTIDLGGKHVATIFSTMNMAGNLGAMLMPVVVIALVEQFTWNEALLLLAGLYFAAAVCWTLVKIESKADNTHREPISSGHDNEKSE